MAAQAVAAKASNAGVHLTRGDCELLLLTQMAKVSNWHDAEFALHVSVKRALREYGEAATTSITKELQQMVDRNVWTPVARSDLTPAQRRAVIRSSMFLKEKFFTTGEFEKLKARLVAGGDQQDKELYEDLSSPTAATASVMAVAAIAAAEGRRVMTIDIGGAFLHADMTSGVTVHVRLDATMTAILVKMRPEYKKYVDDKGELLVRLNKAMYGCVEAANFGTRS